MTADEPGLTVGSGAAPAGSDFAALLRQRRGEAGLTQAELAEASGVAERTVRDVERGRTARPQRTTAELLADALGLAGNERAGFVAAARGEVHAPAPPRAGAPAPGGVPLPPTIPLVGRDDDVRALAGLVTGPASGPLVLVGLAGVGKSVLAVAVAHHVAERFPGGVAGIVVDPDGVSADVLAAIAVVFGVARHDQLADRLAGAPALLLVDAVERAPQAVRAGLAQLPATVRVMATGHAPLGVPGERVWPVAPLEPPPATAGVELAEVTSYPAAALFADRVARSRSEPLADDEASALGSLVRRLGGLPLALELAAAHGRLLRLPEILERYGDRVLDLRAGADQTLRDAVAGSYRLLTTAEQRALRRLAVFRNRWSLELAEQLLDEDPVSLLDRLVGMGLASVRSARENRFRLLDVVRDFATERAEAHGELTQARRLHARVIAALAGRTAPQLAGPGLLAGVAMLDDLASDVWAALSHAANDDPRTALALAAALPRWWRFRGRDVAGRRWLRRLLDDPRTADADRAARAWAQVGLAQLANEHGEGAAEQPAAEAALAEFRRLGDLTGEFTACSALSMVNLAGGRYDEARTHSEAALAVATRTGRLRDATVAQNNLTWHEIRVGDLAAARRRLAAVDRLAAQCGDQRLRVLGAANLAEVARLEGRFEEALATGRRVLVRLGELGDPGHRRRVLGTVGQALGALGRVAEAERVLAVLRADEGDGAGPAGGPVRPGSSDGVYAVVEARIALARGDRVAAAEWFAAAVAAFQRGQDLRDVVESLVGLAACTAEPDRRAGVLAQLERVCADGGFTLLPQERALLDQTV